MWETFEKGNFRKLLSEYESGKGLQVGWYIRWEGKEGLCDTQEMALLGESLQKMQVKQLIERCMKDWHKAS